MTLFHTDEHGVMSNALLDAWSTRISLLQKLQEMIGYFFRDPALLMEAMTHSSAAREYNHRVGAADQALVWNERLEFLGDSVLSLVISTRIMVGTRRLNEGELSKIRAGVVQERSLAGAARDIDLGACLLLSKGEQRSGGSEKDSLLADALEALIGAVYLDGGFGEAEKVVNRVINYQLVDDWRELLVVDYKTQLQEVIQEERKATPFYELADISGPAHAPHFVVQVKVGNDVLAIGRGSSKKRASQDAAMHALKRRADHGAHH